MHGMIDAPHSAGASDARNLIARIDAAECTKERAAALKSLIELALSGPLRERVEAAAYLEAKYGAAVQVFVPGWEATGVH